MKRSLFAVSLVATLGSLLLSAGLYAQTVTLTWTGLASGDDWFSNTENWDVNGAPQINLSAVTTANVVFADSAQHRVRYNDIYVHQLTFNNITKPYDLFGSYYYDTTHIGDGGMVYAPVGAVTSTINDDVMLEASQTWNIQGGMLQIAGPISDQHFDPLANDGLGAYVSGNFSLTKTGAGTLALGHPYATYSGGFVLSGGQVEIGSNSYGDNQSFGTGTLTFDGGTIVATRRFDESSDTVRVYNDIISHGLISTVNETEFHLGYSGEGSSTIELTADTTIQTRGFALFLDGNIIESGGSRKLTMNTPGAVVLDGYNSYTGGTNVIKGLLVFGDSSSIPNNQGGYTGGALMVGSQGYLGIAFVPTGDYTNATETLFLSHFDKANSSGTIGFDSPGDSNFYIYADPIDLTGFNVAAKLGSLSQAILTGDITPQAGANYQFGAGGGLLVVSSKLTGARAVTVDSPVPTPLTLALGSIDTVLEQPLAAAVSNDFTGDVTVTNSAVIFGPGSLPAGTQLHVQANGYIGTAYTDVVTPSAVITNTVDFLSRFPAATSAGMIGFDFFGDGTALVHDNIDLSARFGDSGNIYLGTTTRAVLDGTITPQGNTYRFGAYKDGELTVASTLADGAGARSVVIGDPASPATFADYIHEKGYAQVHLTGTNTYTGGTTLWAGDLFVGNASALGTGTLDVKPFSLPTAVTDILSPGEVPAPQLDVEISGMNIANNVLLETNLNIGSSYNWFDLTGVISGTGALLIQAHAELGLGNPATDATTPNTFSGGIVLDDNSYVDVLSDHATGNSAINFKFYDAEAAFYTANPVVKGLNQDGSSEWGYLWASEDNTTLTIDQSFNSTFNGELDTEYGTLRLTKTGSGTLRLDNVSFYTSGTAEPALAGAPVSLQVNQGTVILTDNVYFSHPDATLWVHGGTLGLENALTSNAVVVDNGGRLIGTGEFASHVTIGTGATLAPGFSDLGVIGSLGFNDLTLSGGGVLEWDIVKAGTSAGQTTDLVAVFNASTLDFSPINLADPADAAHRFTLKVISRQANGSPGLLSDFNPLVGYSWLVFETNGIAGFDPAKVLLDTSLFANSLNGGPQGNGAFSLSQNGTDIFLNFSPIPEPSTYALLGLGLGLSGVAAWRKRRRA